MSTPARGPAQVRAELQVFELPTMELPVHVRRIRKHHEGQDHAMPQTASGSALLERNLDELAVRIG